MLIPRPIVRISLIVQNCRKMQELVGADRTVQNIWRAFETRFNIERTPGQDLLNDLSTGLEIRESDPKAFWKFVDNCGLALYTYFSEFITSFSSDFKFREKF